MEKQTKKSKAKGKAKKQPEKLDNKKSSSNIKIEEGGKEPEDKSKISENKEKSKIFIKDPEHIMNNELKKETDMTYYFCHTYSSNPLQVT